MSTSSLRADYAKTLHQRQSGTCDQGQIDCRQKCWIAFALLLALSGKAGAGEADSLVIGISETLTRNIPPATLLAVRPSVDDLMEKSSGLPVTILNPEPSHQLADRLADNNVQLGVFPGVEFARQRSKHPELRPLAILVNQHSGRQAIAVTRGDSQVTVWADLKGERLAFPKHSPDHCRFFLKAQCQAMGQSPARAFSQITEPATAEDALDDLVDGLVDGVIVDSAALKSFARRKPGRFAKLRVMSKSERFPDTVIAYRDRTLDEGVIQRLRQRLSEADKTPEGRNILTMWKATRFEVPTEEYEKLLADVVKTNPAPDEATSETSFQRLLSGAEAMTKKIASGFQLGAVEK